MGLSSTLKKVWSTLGVFGKDTFGGLMEAIPTESMKKQWNSIHTSFSGVFDKVFEEDQINLDPQDVVCAYISDRVYLNPFERPRHVFGYELEEKFNEFEYALYVNHAAKTRIIGYRGTEFTEIKDYISDLHILFGTQAWNERFSISVKIYEEAKKQYPDYKARVTGHSLGGTIAYFIAKKFLPDRCVVFNPGSSANPTFAQLIADTQMQADWTRHVFTYRIAGDVVSALSVIGYARTFRKRAINPKALHAIANYCALPDVSKEVF